MIVIDTVNQQMYDLIRSMILSRELKPGEQINPKEIAAEHNVSLMPVRNALQQLTAQGLVETRQRVGVFVKKHTGAELRQICEVRKVYELYCLETYVENIDKTVILELFQQIDKTDATDRAMMLLDEHLHDMIVKASNNPFLIHQYTDMFDLFRIHMYSENDNASISKDEHLALLSAIYRGNNRYAYTILEKHLERPNHTYDDFD